MVDKWTLRSVHTLVERLHGCCRSADIRRWKTLVSEWNNQSLATAALDEDYTITASSVAGAALTIQGPGR